MLEQRFCIIIKMWILLSNTKFRVFRYRLPKKSVLSRKKIPPFFSRFFRLSCHLWTQFSQLLKGQFVKFLCLSHREFPEVFKTPPTFNSSTFQSQVIAKMPQKSVFFGTPCKSQKAIQACSNVVITSSFPVELGYSFAKLKINYPRKLVFTKPPHYSRSDPMYYVLLIKLPTFTIHQCYLFL